MSIAALALVAVAAGSFTSALTRQLRLPRPVNTAKVVVLPAAEPPQPGTFGAFAYMAPVTPPPAKEPVRLRRRPKAAPDEAPPAAPIETVTVARAAPLSGTDVADVTPIIPPAALEPEPAAP